MNRLWLLLPLLGLAGCVTPPSAAPTSKMPPDRAAWAAPVQAEQVTPQTAHRISQALADELDREAQQELSGAALPKTAPSRQ